MAAFVQVEESRAQRIQRQQARFRDRGGIFVPSTKNTLVDILLARAVTGESPAKVREQPARACSRSPVKGKATGNDRVVKLAKQSRKATKDRDLAQDDEDVGIDHHPIAGPSKPANKATESRKALSRRGKEEKTQTVTTGPKRKGRPRKSQAVNDDKNTSRSEEPKPATQKRVRATTIKDSIPLKDSESGALSSQHDPLHVQLQRAYLDKTTVAPSKAKGRKRRIVQDSDSDDDQPETKAPSRKRATTSAKSKVTSRKKVVDSESEHEVQERSSKPQKPEVRAIFANDGEDKDEQPTKTRKARARPPDVKGDSSSKAIRKTKPPPNHEQPPDDDDDIPLPALKSKVKSKAKPNPKSKRRVSPASEKSENETDDRVTTRTTGMKVPPRSPPKTKTKTSWDSSHIALEELSQKRQRKRMREDRGTEDEHSDEETADTPAPLKPKKRARVAEAVIKPTVKPKARPKPKLRTPPTPSAKQKENAASAPTNAKPRGPPAHVLQRIRAHVMETDPGPDNEPDPLDCLS